MRSPKIGNLESERQQRVQYVHNKGTPLGSLKKRISAMLSVIDQNGMENGGVLQNGMSLFQDLKLKRRKVDSRCSSDGESIGTSDSAASLSPEALIHNEESPKSKERCVTPEDVGHLASVKAVEFPSQYSLMMKNMEGRGSRAESPDVKRKGSSSPPNGVAKHMHDENIALNNNNDSVINNNILVNNNNNNERKGFEGLKESMSRGGEGRKTPTKGTYGGASTACIKEEGKRKREGSESPEMHKVNGHMEKSSFPQSPVSSKPNSPLIKSEKVFTAVEAEDHGLPPSPRSISSSNSVSSMSHRSPGSKRLNSPSPTHRNSPLHASSHGIQMEPASLLGKQLKGLEQSSPSQQKIMCRSPSSMSSQNSFGPPFYATQLHARLTGGPQTHTKDDPPISVMTSTSLSFHQSMYRINGVRPEVISGGAVTPSSTSPSTLPPSSGNGSFIATPHPTAANGSATSSTPAVFSSHCYSNSYENVRRLSSNGNGSARAKNSSKSSCHAVSGRHDTGFKPYSTKISERTAIPPMGLTTLPSTTIPIIDRIGNSSSSGARIKNEYSHKERISSGASPSGCHTFSNPQHLLNVDHVGGQQRKSPMSRSPNSSPTNSSSSGCSMMNGSSSSSQHSPNDHLMMAGGVIPNGSPASTSSMSSSSSAVSSSHSSGNINLNRTPTVIMGEAGGVRTMLWSQPGQPIPSSSDLLGSSSPPRSNGTSLTNGPNPKSGSPYPNSISGAGSLGSGKGPLRMEQLWASEALNLSTGASNTIHGGQSSSSHQPGNTHQTSNDDDEYEQPMICMICEDRATGLHYGIITCEGCKGFFKRTVQNRRVYTCVADGTCEITKAQRNRCQYCRFKKCIEQGMVLQAVREDRMPGGRNSGAVYNLYKVPVKYRKHKKGNRNASSGSGKGNEKQAVNNNSNNGNHASNGTLQQGVTPNLHAPDPVIMNSSSTNNNSGNNSGHNSGGSNGSIHSQSISVSPLQPQNGNILKAALTNPNEINHLRQASSSTNYENAAAMINHLVQCDNFHDIAAIQNWEELLEGKGDLSDKLCQLGDSIVYRLVQWTKRLPFYQEVPVEIHTRVLTHKWHELLVLTTSAWQAMHTPGPPAGTSVEDETIDNLRVLQKCLQAMMGRSLTLDQLRQDVGQMVDRLTHLTRSFRRLNIRIEEYVTLKVISMLQNNGTRAAECMAIQERYVRCLRTYLEGTYPDQPNRLSDLLCCLPEVQSAASLLLESKMFYVPFLLNSALLQR